MQGSFINAKENSNIVAFFMLVLRLKMLTCAFSCGWCARSCVGRSQGCRCCRAVGVQRCAGTLSGQQTSEGCSGWERGGPLGWRSCQLLQSCWLPSQSCLELRLRMPRQQTSAPCQRGSPLGWALPSVQMTTAPSVSQLLQPTALLQHTIPQVKDQPLIMWNLIPLQVTLSMVCELRLSWQNQRVHLLHFLTDDTYIYVYVYIHMSRKGIGENFTSMHAK